MLAMSKAKVGWTGGKAARAVAKRDLDAVKSLAARAGAVDPIDTTPKTVDMLLRRLQLLRNRSVLLWVGSGCGGEAIAVAQGLLLHEVYRSWRWR